MNNCAFYGRLTADPDITYTNTNKVVTKFNIAVTRSFKNKEGKYDADFIPCVAFDKRGELIGNSFGKGDKIIVMGEMRTETWQDKKTGSTHSMLRLYLNDFNFVENRQQRQQSQPAAGYGEYEDLSNF